MFTNWKAGFDFRMKVAAVILIYAVLRRRPSLSFWRLGSFHWEVWLNLALGMWDLLRKAGAFDEVLNSFEWCSGNYELGRMYCQAKCRLWWENSIGPWAIYFKFRGPNLTKTESGKQGMMFFFHFSNQEKSGGAFGIWYKTNWVFSENKTSDYSKNSFLHFFCCCPCVPPFVNELT